MEQKFEGTPHAEIRLEGRKVVRGEITNDWASRVEWVVRRDGEQVATAPARASDSFEHADETPGEYEISLQMWKYVSYKKDKDGNFTDSKFVGISDSVKFTI